MQLLEVQSVDSTTLLFTLATDTWQQTLMHAVTLMKRRLSGTNISSENNLATFRLNAPVVIGLMMTRAFSFEMSASYFQS